MEPGNCFLVYSVALVHDSGRHADGIMTENKKPALLKSLRYLTLPGTPVARLQYYLFLQKTGRLE
jgi:hypothetical protein